MIRYNASSHSRLTRAVLALGLTLLAAFAQAPRARAGGVVTDCSSPADLNSKLSGGGLVTFNCGANPPAILFPTTFYFTQDTTIDGGGGVTVSGGNSTPLFGVNPGVTLTLRGLSIIKGFASVGDGGAITNSGTLIIENSQFLDNHTSANYSGGAIVTYGPLTITNSEFAHNSGGSGGAVYARFAPAVTTIMGSHFHHNLTTGPSGWGAGMLLWDGAVATVSNSHFNDNTAANGGGGIYNTANSKLTVNASQFRANRTTAAFAEGGALYNAGSLWVVDSSFSQQYASRGGALFVNSGYTDLTRTTIRDNDSALGAGINQKGGDLLMTDVIFHHNGYDLTMGFPNTTLGGALRKEGGNATLLNVTMSGNWATYGGGLYQSGGTTNLTNATISGNRAVAGGGIDQGGGALTLTNVTLFGNAGYDPVNPAFTGGIANRGGTLTTKNTLVADSINSNCYAAIASHSFSYSSDATCGFGPGRDNIKLLLGPLGNFGGFTQTHLPAASSPAVNGGTGIGCPASDQRGVARPQGAACDSGAVEYRPGDLTPWLFLPLIRR